METERLLSNIRIVLVETTHPGNIGAAARAMKNMGLSQLCLVNPRDSFADKPPDKAIWRAASAEDVVNNAMVVSSVDEAIGDCQLVIGTSARDRRIPWPLLDPVECAEKVWVESVAGRDVAILFGRESRGLKNDELHKCHYHVNIPTSESYSSLNLAMAVQIICYELRKASHTVVEPVATEDRWDMAYASASELEHLFEHLERTLVQLEFHDPDNPRQLMTRLRRLFNRVRLDQMEINILRGLLTAINQKLPDADLSSRGEKSGH
ncbi:MAG: tRNA (cytosine(32)/uridine(32)-2'-O)-methyltransferase TrmJ [Pseudomonadales bacterium]